ncbi:MAG TPA: glycine zipper domain-containing protein [Candidatus Brocadiaceae bacterium]
MKNKVGIFVLAGVFFAGGCTTYESRPVPIRPASSYALQARPQYSAVPAQPQYTAVPVQPQATQGVPAEQPLPATTPGVGQAPTPPPAQVTPYQPVQNAGAGLSIGADVLADPIRCKQYFGVDLNRAGVLPVQLVYTNNGNHVYNVQRGQVFAVDYDNNMWQAMTTEQATDRIAGSEVGRDLAMGAGKGALIGGAGGAVLGAALGAALGDPAKGAMIGAGAGGISGGAYGATHEKSKAEKVVREDVMSKALQDQQVAPGYTISGFIFLPKGSFQRVEVNVFDVTAQQPIKYTITPQGSF